MNEEFNYHHTLFAFNSLLRNYPIGAILDDLKVLDIDSYEKLVDKIQNREKVDKQVAALFKPCT